MQRAPDFRFPILGNQDGEDALKGRRERGGGGGERGGGEGGGGGGGLRTLMALSFVLLTSLVRMSHGFSSAVTYQLLREMK